MVLTILTKRKFRWHGHISGSSGMAWTIMQGTIKQEGEKTGEEAERQHKDWKVQEIGEYVRPLEDRI